MLQITPQMKLLVAVEPVDFRQGIDGLVRLCKESLRQDPFERSRRVASWWKDPSRAGSDATGVEAECPDVRTGPRSSHDPRTGLTACSFLLDGTSRMTRKKPEIVEVSASQLDELIPRLGEGPLSAEDRELIRAVFHSYLYLTELLENYRETLASPASAAA